jgi:hypothetical protein
MLTALEILTAFLKQDANTDDIDRMIAMSAYMSKKLAQDMLKPIEQLEAEVWPELAEQQADRGLDELARSTAQEQA